MQTRRKTATTTTSSLSVASDDHSSSIHSRTPSTINRRRIQVPPPPPPIPPPPPPPIPKTIHPRIITVAPPTTPKTTQQQQQQQSIDDGLTASTSPITRRIRRDNETEIPNIHLNLPIQLSPQRTITGRNNNAFDIIQESNLLPDDREEHFDVSSEQRSPLQPQQNPLPIQQQQQQQQQQQDTVDQGPPDDRNQSTIVYRQMVTKEHVKDQQINLQQQQQQPQRTIINHTSQQQRPPQEKNHHENQQESWILRIRAPNNNNINKNGNHTNKDYHRKSSFSSILPMNLLRIQVTENMTVETLSACIVQGLSLHDSYSSFSDYDSTRQYQQQPLAGLFEESTGIFVSLQQLIFGMRHSSNNKNNENKRNCIYAIQLTPPPPLPPRVPIWEQYPELLYLIGIPLVTTLLYWYGNTMVEIISNTSITLYNVSIHWPLQELYRHGPWFIGWEGESLPRICSRITYHGDERFWGGINLKECERIYLSKEEAFLKMMKPIVYSCSIVLFIMFIRFLLWEWNRLEHSRRQQQRVPIDRDMVDTYRAFQVLLRQVRREIQPPKH